jgi:hypothetical protein
MKAVEPKPDIATALTVPQFCQMFCISLELAPHEMRTDQGVKIALESIAQWRCDVEGLRIFVRRYLCR